MKDKEVRLLVLDIRHDLDLGLKGGERREAELKSLREDVNEIDEDLNSSYYQKVFEKDMMCSLLGNVINPSPVEPSRIDKIELKLDALIEHLKIEYKEEPDNDSYPKYVKRSKQ